MNRQLTVVVKPGVSHADVLRDCGGFLNLWTWQLRVMEIEADEVDGDATLARFQAHPGVACAAFAGRVEFPWFPNDPGLAQGNNRWYLDALRVPQAWDVTRGDPSIVVAVIDTGLMWFNYDYAPTGITLPHRSHPDLPQVYEDNAFPSEWRHTYQVATGDVFPYDLTVSSGSIDPHAYLSHGTSTSGCILAKADNGAYLAGIAHLCTGSMYGISVSQAWPTETALSTAIVMAADHGAHVVSMSVLLGSDPAHVVQTSVDYARGLGLGALASSTYYAAGARVRDTGGWIWRCTSAGTTGSSAALPSTRQTYGTTSTQGGATFTAMSSKGCVLVCAAGNEAIPAAGRGVPVDCTGTVVVGGSNEQDQWIYEVPNQTFNSYWGSNYGPRIDLIAPGTNIPIISTDNALDQQPDGSWIGGPVPSIWVYGGTSFSCPYTSGVFGLVFSANPDLTPDEAIDVVRSTSRQPTTTGDFATKFPNAGIVDAHAAVVKARGSFRVSGHAPLSPTSARIYGERVAGTTIAVTGG